MNQPQFSNATIIKKIPQTPELTHIEVACDSTILKSFTTPGQYVILGRGDPCDRPGRIQDSPLHYYAMSNPPGEKHFSFLIKNTGMTAKNILDQQNSLLISPVLGKGFPAPQTSHHNILLVGVGSCFGVFRSLILHFFSTLQKPQITFLYGAKTAMDIPYQKEIKTWVGAEEITPPRPLRGLPPLKIRGGWGSYDGRVGSKPLQFLPSLSEPDQKWQGLTGQVQTHFDSVLINAQTAVYLCGMKEMIEDCQKLLLQKGVPPSSIFLNY